jgi:hypothetical protein
MAEEDFMDGIGDATYEVTEEDENAEPTLNVVPETLDLKATSTTAYSPDATKPGKPRTLRAGYNSETEVLTVVFRDGTWWNYYDVPRDVWDAFKAARSKGKFLHEEGFNAGKYAMGATDMSTVSKQQRVMLAYSVETSRRLQQALKGKQSTKLYGKWVNYRLRGQGGFKK